MIAPTLQQARGFRSDMPIRRIGQVAPAVHLLTDRIDGGEVISLGFGREPFALVEYQFAPFRFAFTLAWFRYGVKNSAVRRLV